jgi:hypothetical protein
MHKTLIAAGYGVFDSSNARQLELGLRARAVHRAKNLLYVFSSRLAADCALVISAASLERMEWGLPEPQLILTHEFGALTTTPDIARCLARGALEKPFDLYELQAMAFECRDFLCESEDGGATCATSCR